MQPNVIEDLEAARLEALHSYQVLDTNSERAFDDLTRLVADVCEMPIALISLVDADRLWFKSRHGLDVIEAPRDQSLCDYAIRHQGATVVEDTLQDERFANIPLVTGAPNIRFYAGSPLVDVDGHALGTLCAIDRKPRHLTGKQLDTLEQLSRQVVHLLKLRRNHRKLAGCLDRIRNIADMIPMCSHCHAVRDEDDEWQRVEQYFRDVNGTQFTHGVCPACMVEHYPVLDGVPQR